jgi:hypothetical protein
LVVQNKFLLFPELLNFIYLLLKEEMEAADRLILIVVDWMCSFHFIFSEQVRFALIRSQQLLELPPAGRGMLLAWHSIS